MTLFRTLLLSLSAIVLVACASTGGKQAPAGQTAGERALARWQALIDGKGELAYDYLTPGMRSTKSRETYATEAAQKPVSYTSVKPVEEQCAGDVCTVTVELEYEVNVPLAGVGRQHLPAYLEERWIRLDGSWYYLPAEVR